MYVCHNNSCHVYVMNYYFSSSSEQLEVLVRNHWNYYFSSSSEPLELFVVLVQNCWNYYVSFSSEPLELLFLF